MKYLALDTETTGLDLYHDCRPFFASTCDSDGNVAYFEWDVDPITREVDIPNEDALEIVQMMNNAERIIGHNFKFDATALITSGIWKDPHTFPWGKVEDTMMAAHLLASLKPRNLTDVAMLYLGVDIEPLEKAARECSVKARNIVGRKYPNWHKSYKDDPDNPSAKKLWRSDMWLPRVLAQYEKEEMGVLDYRPNHPFWTVLKDYAVADAEVTAALWPVMISLIRERNLEKIYRERMKLVGIAQRMESYGMTRSKPRSDTMFSVRLKESEKHACSCVNIARSYGCNLVLPKKGRSDSLVKFCFGEKVPGEYEGGYPRYNPNSSDGTKSLGLPIVKRTEKGEPSLNKEALEVYLNTLSPRKKAHRFIESLVEKSRVDQDLAFLRAYERFALPHPFVTDGNWTLLHPNLNLTGTDTLRFSSSNPNSQNCKVDEDEDKSLRYCFGPAAGREWWSIDYKNLELRIPFYLSGEKELIALFEKPNDPPYYGSHHMLTLHTLFPDVWEQVLKEVGPEKVAEVCKKEHKRLYKRVKNGNFAKQYGGQVAKVDSTFGLDGAYDMLESKFTKLAKLNRDTIAYANKYGYVETIPDKTVDPNRGYPLMCSRMDNGSILPTVPFNYKIQGTACWVKSRAITKVEENLRGWHKDGFDGHLILDVHDELVFDFPKVGDPTKYNPKATTRIEKLEAKTIEQTTNLWRVRIIQQKMQSCGSDLVFPIPTPTSAEYHVESWAKGIPI